MEENNKEELVEEPKSNDTEEVTPVLEKNAEDVVIEEKDSVSTDSNITDTPVVEEHQETVVEEVKEDVKFETTITVDKVPTNEFEMVNNVEPQKNIEPVKEEVPKKKSKKKLIIILSIIALLVIVAVVVVVLLMNKDEKKPEDKPKEPEIEEPTISEEEYGNIMTTYGDNLYAYVRDQIGLGNDVSKINLEELTLLESNEVSCETVSIDNTGNIVLDGCVIDESENKYNYKKEHSAESGAKKNYAVSKKGKLTFKYQVKNYEKGVDEPPTKTYSFNCEEASCAIEKVYGFHAIVREESGKKYIYDFKNKKKIYTVLPGYDVTIIGDYDNSFTEKVSSLILLKNANGEEALFNIKTKSYVYNYGEYTYDWFVENTKGTAANPCTACIYHNCEFPKFDSYLKIYKDGYAGIIRTDTFEVVLAPTEYTDVNISGEYIYTEKDNKFGLLSYDSKTNKVEELSEPLYESIDVNSDYIYVTKSGKIGAFDKKMSKQYLNGKYYDAVGMAKHGGKHYGLILTGNMIKLLDADGNTVKTFKDVYIPADAKYANTKSRFWSEDDMPGFKVTDPQYLGALESSQCEFRCANKVGDDSSLYLSCVDKCQRQYIKEHDGGCLEYFYDFETESLRKITDICSNALHC